MVCKISPKCCNEDSFMYSLLLSLRYYDISHNPERITKLRSYMSKYNFTDTSPARFEINNPHVSLEIVDEDRNIIYSPSNTSNNKVLIVQLEDNIYATLKPIKNKYISLKEILQCFSHKEMSDMIVQKIIIDDINRNE